MWCTLYKCRILFYRISTRRQIYRELQEQCITNPEALDKTQLEMYNSYTSDCNHFLGSPGIDCIDFKRNNGSVLKAAIFVMTAIWDSALWRPSAEVSPDRDCNAGLPQGTCLSPIHFVWSISTAYGPLQLDLWVKVVEDHEGHLNHNVHPFSARAAPFQPCIQFSMNTTLLHILWEHQDA